MIGLPGGAHEGRPAGWVAGRLKQQRPALRAPESLLSPAAALVAVPLLAERGVVMNRRGRSPLHYRLDPRTSSVRMTNPSILRIDRRAGC